MERECVRERRWMTREEFLDLLGVANLIPGPTSTELAMHLGWRRAGFPGLLAAGLAFIAPSFLLVLSMAALYVSTGDLPVVRSLLAAVQPVVLIVVLDALVPLARSVARSRFAIVIALGAALLTEMKVPTIAILLLGGVVHALGPRRWVVSMALGVAFTADVGAAAAAIVHIPEVFVYFLGVGSLLFGSGYVLLPVLEGDLVQRKGWLSSQQLIDAIAAGQATPGPVFTTATFIGYVLGGGWGAVAATVGIFLPSFVLSACASVMFERLRRSTLARAFLAGVNAAAVALIAGVLVELATASITGIAPAILAVLAAVLVFAVRVNPGVVLLLAALLGVTKSLL
jgi:chromate transporter